MCGIVTVAGALDGSIEAAFEDMLIMDSVRGKHSTGAAFIRKNEVDIVKGAIYPYDLIDSAAFRANRAKFNMAIIGHNRAATRGKISDDNAHPFRNGDIVLVHNGTLNSEYSLPGYNQFETDSETIAHSINVIGIEETWKVLSGAAALVWYNSHSRSLFAITNRERPLWWGLLKGGKTIVICSEPMIARASLIRHSEEVEKEGFTMMDKDVLHEIRYNPKKTRLTMSSRPIEGYKEYTGKWDWDKEAEEYVKTSWRNTYVKHTEHKNDKAFSVIEHLRNSTDHSMPSTSMAQKIAEAATKALVALNSLGTNNTNTNVVPFSSGKYDYEMLAADEQLKLDNMWGPRDKLMSRRDFHETYRTCMDCGQDMDTEYTTSVIVSKDDALCGACAEHYKMQGLHLGMLNWSN